MFTKFDKAMKSLEIYHVLKVPPGAYPVLRIDGRTFSKVTGRLGLKKPFDPNFDDWMSTVTRVLVENLQAVYGYHQSDEISIVLPATCNLFDREVEKLCSVSAGLASSAFMKCLMTSMVDTGKTSMQEGEFPHFDSRVIVACTPRMVTDVLLWRQQDAIRNALNSYAHWTAIQKGNFTARAAGKLFENQSVGFKNEYLYQHGINFNNVPAWEKRGTGYFWTDFIKQGFNPKTGEKPLTVRRMLKRDVELPEGEFYRAFLLDRVLRCGLQS